MANKKGPLSKVETFYIEEQTKLGKNLDEIAADLNRPQSIVSKHITKATSQAKKNNFGAGQHFARQGGATIMTENASTIADAKRKLSVKRPTSCVTKIKPE